MSKFGNSCKKPQFSLNFSPEDVKFGKFVQKKLTQGNVGGEIILAKGIIFTNIYLVNGYILKLWAAHRYPKFSREPPPPMARCLNQ